MFKIKNILTNDDLKNVEKYKQNNIIKKFYRFRTVDKLLSLLFVILILLIAADFLSCPSRNQQKEQGNQSCGSNDVMKGQLAAALRELDLLKRQNETLFNIFQEVNQVKKPETNEERIKMFSFLWKSFEEAQEVMQIKIYFKQEAQNHSVRADDGPSVLYEMSRRKVEDNISEMWLYFGAQLRELKKVETIGNITNTSLLIDRMLEEGVEHKRSLLQAARNMNANDGYSTWRDRESKELSDLVQQRLHYLQHPRDCNKARKLVCEVKKFCGFSCQLNQIFYCLVEAYASKRTMVLQSEIWTQYIPSNWNDIFLPISNCTAEESSDFWPGRNDSQSILMGHMVNKLKPPPQYIPPSVPRDLAPRLERLHGDPETWWVGQFWKYLLKPQPALRDYLDNTTRILKFQKPIVGLHIRRSDKVFLKEASFHSLEEYMQKVEEYYTQLELSQKVDQRRIFIASDDPTVFEEAKTKYPAYTILDNINASKTATVDERSTNKGVFEIISDIYHLAHSDLIVCTFSSGVSRLAYEIMQSLHPDASAKFRSLDDIYYSSGQVKPRYHQVIYEHRARRPEEIDLNIGDIVNVLGNHWDGYSLGTNQRTSKKGLYPSHKVIDKLDIVDFPTFSELEDNV